MKKALVIDDNRIAADILCQFLRLLEIETKPVYGPGPAMRLLRETPPDVVFLDLNMPGLDGFEVLGFLRRDPNTAEIPVIIVTSDDQRETAQRAREEGALAILIKPVSIESLEAVLRQAQLI